ncbi:hypothetical protein VCHA53O466_320006 [Vibrio chagasii]|nr:hypothetical protein VCHA53O466_320006 [Vibrio chagasii]
MTQSITEAKKRGAFWVKNLPVKVLKAQTSSNDQCPVPTKNFMLSLLVKSETAINGRNVFVLDVWSEKASSIHMPKEGSMLSVSGMLETTYDNYYGKRKGIPLKYPKFNSDYTDLSITDAKFSLASNLNPVFNLGLKMIRQAGKSLANNDVFALVHDKGNEEAELVKLYVASSRDDAWQQTEDEYSHMLKFLGAYHREYPAPKKDNGCHVVNLTPEQKPKGRLKLVRLDYKTPQQAWNGFHNAFERQWESMNS